MANLINYSIGKKKNMPKKNLGKKPKERRKKCLVRSQSQSQKVVLMNESANS
jgi:hypothetical protein